MSVSHKSFNTQVLRLIVYKRALHPELFDLQSRGIYRHGEYEAEVWIVPRGHVVRFQVGEHCLTETVVEGGNHLPETGLVHALPCIGEKEFEMDPQDGPLGYVTTLQTEALTDNLYRTTYQEMLDFAHETEALHYQWSDEDGARCLSLLDCQKYRGEFHMQSYHLLGSSRLVLRTQTIFEDLS